MGRRRGEGQLRWLYGHRSRFRRDRVERRRLAPAGVGDARVAQRRWRDGARLGASVRQRSRISRSVRIESHRRVSGSRSDLARPEPRSPGRRKRRNPDRAHARRPHPPAAVVHVRRHAKRVREPVRAVGVPDAPLLGSCAERRRDQRVEQRLGRHRGPGRARAQHLHHGRVVRGGADRTDRRRLLRRAAAATRHTRRANRRPAGRSAAPEGARARPEPLRTTARVRRRLAALAKPARRFRLRSAARRRGFGRHPRARQLRNGHPGA